MNDQALIGLDEVAAVHTGLTPLYHSLGQVIRGKIQSGEWSVGQQIPSERADGLRRTLRSYPAPGGAEG